MKQENVKDALREEICERLLQNRNLHRIIEYWKS